MNPFEMTKVGILTYSKANGTLGVPVTYGSVLKSIRADKSPQRKAELRYESYIVKYAYQKLMQENENCI